jgi:nucleoside-diphosphate-sugar epimerase
VIRWIRDWLGTAAHDEITPGDWVVVDVRHHVDKAGNRPEALRESIEAALAQRHDGRKIVLACDFGISRSNAIAAGVLSLAEGLGFDDALAEVIAKTGEAQVKLEMIGSVRAAIGAAAPSRQDGTVLVTGGTGFIGAQFVSRLSDGRSVSAPARGELDLTSGSAALGQYCERHRIGQIVHLAYPRHYTNPGAVGESLTMLQAVLDVGKALGLRLVFASGWVVFSGYAARSLLADENLARRSKGVYGDAKLLEETLIDAHLQRGDVRATICRFSPVYGPGGARPRLIRTFAEALRAGRQVLTHRYLNGVPALDLLHVDDAVSALTAIVQSECVGAFHFGTGKLTETPEIARLLARLLGTKLNHTELTIDDETSNIALASGKALQQLGWQPTIDAEAGLTTVLQHLAG